MTFPHEIILASASARRSELLTQAGYSFRVLPPAHEAEGPIAPGEDAPRFVARLAMQKAASVAHRLTVDPLTAGPHTPGIIVACDTVAQCQGQILGKPADQHDARRMLSLLSGREHQAISGLCVWPLDRRPDVEVAHTTLAMEPLAPRQIDDYLATGLWRGKAGAFGYQDQLGWLRIIKGSPTNVVGLPMELLAEMLARLTR